LQIESKTGIFHAFSRHLIHDNNVFNRLTSILTGATVQTSIAPTNRNDNYNFDNLAVL